MEKKLIIVGAVGGLAVMGVGLALFYKHQLDLAMQYCYKISNFKPIKISKDLISFDLYMQIENKSSFAIELEGYDFDIFVNGKKASHVSSKDVTPIKNNGISEMHFNVTFNPQDFGNLAFVLQLVTDFLKDKSKINIRCTGTLNARADFITLHGFPLDITMTVADILAPPDPNAPISVCNIKKK